MRRVLALFMCMILVTPFGVWQDRESGKNSAVSDIIVRVEEIIENRTSNSDTFLMSDGSCEMVVYSEDKYYWNESGGYVEIDNSIVKDPHIIADWQYTYTNKADNYKAHFAENEARVLVAHGGDELSFELSDRLVSTAIYGKDILQREIAGYCLGGENCIMYPESRPETDIVYETVHGAVKEYIVLNSPTAERNFQFIFSCRGCVLNESGNDKVSFNDSETEEEHFSLGNLFAVDSNGIVCTELSYLINPLEDGRISISFSIPERYLNDPERAFPILVDPTVLISGSSSTYDTYVNQQYPTSNYYLNTYVWTGVDGNNAMRTLIKFNLPNNVNANQLTRATLRLQKRDYQNPVILGFRITSSWSSSTATWNNQPSYNASGYTTLALADGNDWFKMDVTDIVAGWLSGTYNNYGFLLREMSEFLINRKTKFYSSDSDYPHRPELVIRYVNSLGSRKYQQVPETMEGQSNCMGYALEKNQVIDANTLQIQDSDVLGKTKQQLLDYIASKAVAWMSSNFGTSNYASLSAYDASISTSSPGWFRVALRVGFDDSNGNGVIDAGEDWDYHWKYQTCDYRGAWAAKEGGMFSWLDYESNGIDPASAAWDKEESIWGYDSSLKYYQIKDIRTVSGWTEE